MSPNTSRERITWMSYQLRIDPKSMKAARFISRLQKAIQKALIASGKTQQEVAEIIGVDRSVINRRLKGSANITARSISDFAFAFNKDVVIEFVDKDQGRRSNRGAMTTNKVDNVVTSAIADCHRPKSTIEPDGEIKFQRAAL